jgi:O-antigen biosynthesis protein WbqP
MTRFFDIVFAVVGLIVLMPIMMVLTIIGFFDTGSPIFKQKRVGKHKKPFHLYKFRTMNINTKSEATHLISVNSVTKFGSFLRKTKLDEIPQLVNVLLGQMSLVGPRPCLFNQDELIEEREKRGVFSSLPGITGLAQLTNIDMSTPVKLSKVDAQMLNTMSLRLYFLYILKTIIGGGRGDNVQQNEFP